MQRNWFPRVFSSTNCFCQPSSVPAVLWAYAQGISQLRREWTPSFLWEQNSAAAPLRLTIRPVETMIVQALFFVIAGILILGRRPARSSTFYQGVDQMGLFIG